MREGPSRAAESRVNESSGLPAPMLRHLVWFVSVLLSLGAIAAQPAPPFVRRDALLVNVTESDLNRIVLGAFHSNGGPNFEGTRHRVSAAVSELTYEARLSDPLVTLGERGAASLTFDIRSASLQIGRLERKIAGRAASCENASLTVDPSRPLRVTVALEFRVEDGDLRVVPASVSVPDAESRMSLMKPSHCTNAPLPRWLLWWLGKPYLRRYLTNLDAILLDRAKSAARVEQTRDVLRRSWEGSGGEQLHVFAAALDTSARSLLVSLTAASGPDDSGPSAAPVPAGLPTDRSFLAVSETFTNEVLRRAVARMSVERLRPAGNLGKLVRSGSVYALIPGLRGLDRTDTLLYSVDFRTAPRVEFSKVPGGEAMIHFLASDVDLRLWKEDAHGTSLLGTLEVESGRVAVVPFWSVLGGVSFRIVENEWTVSSKGIRFDDALVAATLQELTFGRIFETTYEPLGASRLHVGTTNFEPRAFDAVGDYLVIELGAEGSDLWERAAGAPMRIGTLPASH